MIQKPLLWAEVGKSACVLVGICELRLSLPARYDPQALALVGVAFLSLLVLFSHLAHQPTARSELSSDFRVRSAAFPVRLWYYPEC
jgi:hypothetical protein